MVFVVAYNGATNQIRTDDLVITNDVRYRLRYSSRIAQRRTFYHKGVILSIVLEKIVDKIKKT